MSPSTAPVILSFAPVARGFGADEDEEVDGEGEDEDEEVDGEGEDEEVEVEGEGGEGG